MSDFATLGMDIETQGLTAGQAELNKLVQTGARAETQLGKAAQKIGTGFDGVSSASQMMSKATARAMGGMGHQSRMMAMQLSQVAQQASATGNVVQALAIQLPDMAMGFGTIGIAAGVLAAVALPALASMFRSTADSGKEAREAAEKLAESFDQVMAYARVAAESTATLTEQFGQFAGQVRGFSDFMAGVQLGQTFDDLGKTIDPLQAQLAGVKSALDVVSMGQAQVNSLQAEGGTQLLLAQQALEGFQSSAFGAAASLGLLPEQAVELMAALDALDAAKTLPDMARHAGAALAIFQQLAPTGRELPAPLREAAAALELIQRRAAETAQVVTPIPPLLESAGRAADGAAGAVGRIGDAAQGAYGVVSDLVGKLWEAAAAQSAANDKLAQMAVEFSPGGQAMMEFGSRAPGGTSAQNALADRNEPEQGGGGAGGGSGLGRSSQDAMTALGAMLGPDPRAEIEAWYAEAMTALQEAQLIERGMLEEHNAYRLQIEQSYSDQLLALRRAQQDENLSHYESFFGTMAGVFQSGGEKMLGISKAFGLAEAAVSIWRGAAKALELPFPASLSAWAQVIATGAKALTGIRQAKPGSASLGGGGGGQAAAPPPRPTQNVVIDMVNASPSQIGGIQNLVNMLTEANRQGYDLNAIVRGA